MSSDEVIWRAGSRFARLFVGDEEVRLEEEGCGRRMESRVKSPGDDDCECGMVACDRQPRRGHALADRGAFRGPVA